MSCRIHVFPTVLSPSLSANYTSKNLISVSPRPRFSLNRSRPNTQLSWKKTLKPLKRRKLEIRSSTHDPGETGRWGKFVPKGAVAEKIFRLISGATSSPICQFVSSPTTFLHSVDPRIKLVWLLALVALPARSHIVMRFGLVIYLALLSIWILPKHVWMDQLGRVGLLSGFLFLMLGFGSDGVPPLVQLRTPPAAMVGLPDIPMSLGGYSYLVMKLGPLQLTRKGLSVASTSACLTFTVRNAALGIVARRIKWRQLTVMETIDIYVIYVRRIFKNIFSHAEQISQAMIVRGFRGKSNYHKIYLLSDSSDSSLGMEDIISLLCLVALIGGAFLSEFFLT
ncbi:PREDICTED: protein ABCI12, chloroplastic isoform X2 [Nelumbo nucifera]|uniref:Protein ABCI12, chloroplastic isoform X2 n=1 Tax=Nelumbo nucifera TaxID=4432 RepID=A0A1U8QCC9_NELNU|nr:PREDICTED: protein ABCI12, chloroplastic isoform X2 [Nelumbo nucifera]